MTLRYQIAVWKDYHNRYTVKILEDIWDISATAKTAKDAIKEIKNYLQKEDYDYLDEPSIVDPVLQYVQVPMRPVYRYNDRNYPDDRVFQLKVAAITGKNDDGMLVCFLPTLNISFYYYKNDKLAEMIKHHVNSELSEQNPLEISQSIMPKEIYLDELVVQVKPDSPDLEEEEDIDTLKEIAEPLGDSLLRKRFPRAWKRDTIIEELCRVLKEERGNVILLGASGIGKTTILVDAVRRLEKKDRNHKFWLTSANRIIAGMRYLGEWEQRLEAAQSELAGIQGVLCVEKLVDLIQVGSSEPGSSIASFLSTFLQYGYLRMLAEATFEELEICRRLLPGFVEQFQIIKIPEFTRTEALDVLNILSDKATQDKGISIDRDNIAFIEKLFRRFRPYESFPGKVTAFINDLLSLAKRKKMAQLDKNTIVEQFIQQTGLPEIIIRDDKPLKYENVVQELKSKVIAQDEACETLAHTIITFKSGLNDPRRPVGVYLFTGPTGVGKTQLAKVLSDYLFSHGNKKNVLIRLDMSEYAGLDATHRFLTNHLGDPAPHIQRIRQHPFAILLLDEIEKADPDVFDLILNLLDEGYISDKRGVKTWFRSSVIIMTSNVGSAKKSIRGFGDGVSKKQSLKELLEYFRPEFLNRVDDIITFLPLTKDSIQKITRLELEQLSGRGGLVNYNISLSYDEKVLQYISDIGFDPKYGARPLQRIIEEKVITPISEYLVRNHDLRDSGIHLTLSDDQKILIS